MAIPISCPYTCGELFQGTIDGFSCLVSCPISIYSTALPTPGRPQPPLPPKAQRALVSLPYAAHLPVELRQRLPAGRGYGTSTADIGSTLFAAARWANIPLDPIEASRLAVRIEPTDSSLLPGLTLFDHRQGALVEYLGAPPPVTVVILDPGGTVDSEAFNAQDWKDSLRKIASLHRQAFDLLKDAITRQDIDAMGEAASLSAAAHQDILLNPWLEHALALARQVGACGVCRAHSGSILGMLFPKNAFDHQSVIPYLQKRLPKRIHLQVTEITGGGSVMEATALQFQDEIQ